MKSFLRCLPGLSALTLCFVAVACGSSSSGGGGTHDAAPVARDGAADAAIVSDVRLADTHVEPNADGSSADAATDMDGGQPDAGADAPTTADGPADDAAVTSAEDASPDAEEPEDAAPDAVAMCGHIQCDCTLHGKDLFGGMNYVTNPPYDFKVEVVTNGLPDLYVQEVTAAGLATRCGQWKTDSFVPKFRVLKVTAPALSDFRIQIDNLLPGIPGHRF
jgi:hypothetical protein